MAMAFTFGGVSSSRKRSNTADIQNFVLDDQVKGDYYLLLLDQIVDQKSIDYIKKELQKNKIDNYIILSSITTTDLSKDSTSELLEIESPWRKFLNYAGFQPKAILSFGSACRLITGSADVLWNQFIDDKFNNTFFYANQVYCKVTDGLRIYPCGPIKECVTGTWVTKHMSFQMKQMAANPRSKFKYNNKEYQIIECTGDRSINSALKSLLNSDVLSLDIETNMLDYSLPGSEIHCIQLSKDGEKAYFILWKNLVNFRLLLIEVISSAKVLVGSNLKFDTKWLWSKGVVFPTKNIWATDLMSHALNSDLAKGLKSLAFRYTHLGGYDKELESIKKRLKIERYSDIPSDILQTYSGLDSIVCWRIFHALKENIEYVDKKFPNDKDPEWTIERFIEEIMNPNYHTVIKTEFRGVFINKENLLSGRDYLNNKIQKLKDELINTLNNEIEEVIKTGKQIKRIKPDFEFESTQKLGILLEDIGWPCIERNKDNHYSTADACIEQWAQNGYKAAELIRELRTTQVGIKTFLGSTDELNSSDITGWPQFIRQHPDGSYRVHPNCRVMDAESFRHKMTEPNFQQIPRNGDIGNLCKKVISVPAYIVEGQYQKITDDNGKVWTTEYTDWFNTQRGQVNFKELKPDDTILSYCYPDNQGPKNNYFIEGNYEN